MLFDKDTVECGWLINPVSFGKTIALLNIALKTEGLSEYVKEEIKDHVDELDNLRCNAYLKVI